jgi:hypothetical protein
MELSVRHKRAWYVTWCGLGSVSGPGKRRISAGWVHYQIGRREMIRENRKSKGRGMNEFRLSNWQPVDGDGVGEGDKRPLRPCEDPLSALSLWLLAPTNNN